MIKRPLLVAGTLLAMSRSALSQAAEPVDMADAMRANGKIYVVVTVLSVIFIGLVVYLVRLDRRIARLERENGARSKS
jgi:CcmD family protein